MNDANEVTEEAAAVLQDVDLGPSRTRTGTTSTRKHCLSRFVAVEPLVLILTLLDAAGETSYFNFLKNKVCETVYNNSICDAIAVNSSLYSNENTQVLATVSQFTTYQSLAADIPGIFTAWIIGLWGDRISRKLVFYICLVSVSLQYGAQFLVMCFSALPYQLVIVSNLLSGLTGYTTMYAACAYIGHLAYLHGESESEVQEVNESTALIRPENRKKQFDKSGKHRLSRYSTVHSMFYLGLTIGYLASGWVASLFTPQVFRAACALTPLLLLVYTVFFIPDLPPKETEIELRNVRSLCGQFRCSSLVKPIAILCKPRTGILRKQLMLALSSLMLYYIAITSISCNLYWFLTYPPISMSAKLYGYFNAANYAIGWLLLLLVLPSIKLMYPHADSALFALIGLLMQAYSQATLAFSSTSTHVFLLLGTLGFRVWVNTSLETVISSSVSAHEQGVVFAAVASGERITDWPARLLFAYLIFPSTMAYFPGGTMLAGAISMLITAAAVVCLIVIRRKANPTETDNFDK